MSAKQRTPIVAGAFVEEGPRVTWDNPKLAMAALKAWVGQRITVTIAQEEQRRSQRAHNYLFAVIYDVLERESGYSKEELHEIFKLRHNAKIVIDPVTGEEVRIAMSTKTLSVEKMSEFMERVMWDGATIYGVSFPEPRKGEEWRDADAA